MIVTGESYRMSLRGFSPGVSVNGEQRPQITALTNDTDQPYDAAE
ncbi:MAG: hypothetical protein AAF709_13045 [Pseudomonadota bacterium]